MPEPIGPHSLASAVLVERGGHFYFYQPGLGVIGSAKTISAAYEEFVEERRKYLEEVERAGLSAFPAPSPDGEISAVALRPSLSRELLLFLAKTAIVLAVIGVIGLFAGVVVTRAIDDVAGSLARIRPISMEDVAVKAADIARDLRSLSPEKRETLLRSIAAISREVEPMADAWRNPRQVPEGSKN